MQVLRQGGTLGTEDVQRMLAGAGGRWGEKGRGEGELWDGGSRDLDKYCGKGWDYDFTDVSERNDI